VIVPKEILDLSADIYREDGERERLLRTACRALEMTRSEVLIEYGDPKTWPKPLICKHIGD
jgi:hypothetical protein